MWQHNTNRYILNSYHDTVRVISVVLFLPVWVSVCLGSCMFAPVKVEQQIIVHSSGFSISKSPKQHPAAPSQLVSDKQAVIVNSQRHP